MQENISELCSIASLNDITEDQEQKRKLNYLIYKIILSFETKEKEEIELIEHLHEIKFQLKKNTNNAESIHKLIEKEMEEITKLGHTIINRLWNEVKNEVNK